MTRQFEIAPWSYVDGTETVAEWTVIADGRDTLIVDDSYDALAAAIADGSIEALIAD